MEKKEQEMLEKIRSASEELPVPEALETDRIREKLKEHDREKEEKKGRAKRFFRSVRGRQAAALAAGLALVCLAGVVYTMTGREDSAGYGDGTASEAEGSSGGRASRSEDFRAAESYDDIYAYLEDYQKEHAAGRSRAINEESASGTAASSGAASSGVQAGRSAAADTASGTASYEGSYSDTNVRQEGVGEGDVVKTDGRYIYTLSDDGEISIVDTEGGMKEAGVINEDRPVLEFYVSDDRLMMVTYAAEKSTAAEDRDEVDSSYYYYGYNSGVAVVTYDLSDKETPKKLGEVTQSGSYESSRLAGDYLYVFSSFHADMYAAPEARDSYIPQAGGSLIGESSIYLPETENPTQYLVITSMDIKSPDKLADSRAVFSGYGELYVSNENIYWYEEKTVSSFSELESRTVIRKISYRDGQLEPVAKAEVPGAVDDSFSIDEYEGNLRVVTTDDEANGLYILDGNMKELGRINNLAKDERVYSARFMGDTGYFVTFRNTDPLFSVDLSDPENPEILGELKIPGFSDYLHPYGDGLLLGIGMDADEETGATGGVKLSMFNVGDSSDVKEENTFIMDNVYSADVLYDYKAALIDPERNIIGFSAYNGAQEKYYVFSYDSEKGFTCLMEEQVNGSSQRAARGVYIDNILYVVKGNIIETYGMDDYKKIDDIIL